MIKSSSAMAYFGLLISIAALSPFENAASAVASASSHRCGSRELKVVRIQESEGQRVQVAFIGNNGDPVFPDVVWPGEFLSLCRMGAFLLLDTSVHHKPGHSFLMSATAVTIASFTFGEIAEFGSSPDGKVFWIQSHPTIGTTPTTLLRVVDYRGREVLTKSFGRKGLQTIRYEGRTYDIQVAAPDFPG